MQTLRLAALCRVSAVCLLAFAATGCEDADAPNDARDIAAVSTDSGLIDGGSRDTRLLDAGVDAAPPAAPKMCFSPHNPPDSSAFRSTDQRGCECVHTRSTAYCVGPVAIRCTKDSVVWLVGLDGPCFPTRRPDPVGSCQQLGGVLTTRGTTCPSGFAVRRGYYHTAEDAGVGEYEDCCYPIEVPAKNCTRAGLTVLPAGTQSSLLGTTCSNGGALRSFVIDQPTPSLCCAAP